MASSGKKNWTTPKLMAFVRANREERVLDTCKQYAGGQGQYATHVGCRGKSTCTSYCYDFGS